MKIFKNLFKRGPSVEELIDRAVNNERQLVQQKLDAENLLKVTEKNAQLLAEKEAALLEAAKPTASIVFENRKMIVKSYNKAFVEDLRTTLGDLTVGKTDDEVVNIFVGRENEEFEEPRLDVIHSGITEDGQVQMKLDWNRSFIQHLKENGIEGETEEDSINKYLSLITKQVADETGLFDSLDPRIAQQELDEILAIERDEAAKQIEEAQKATRKSERKTRQYRKKAEK